MPLNNARPHYNPDKNQDNHSDKIKDNNPHRNQQNPQDNGSMEEDVDASNVRMPDAVTNVGIVSSVEAVGIMPGVATVVPARFRETTQGHTRGTW